MHLRVASGRSRTNRHKNTLYFLRNLPAALEPFHQLSEMAGCSLGDTLGVSWKLCQYTDPIEAVHSNLRPTMTYLGLTLNVSPKAEVSNRWAPTDSTFGLYSINSPTNYEENLKSAFMKLRTIGGRTLWQNSIFDTKSQTLNFKWRLGSFGRKLTFGTKCGLFGTVCGV